MYQVSAFGEGAKVGIVIGYRLTKGISCNKNSGITDNNIMTGKQLPVIILLDI